MWPHNPVVNSFSSKTCIDHDLHVEDYKLISLNHHVIWPICIISWFNVDLNVEFSKCVWLFYSRKKDYICALVDTKTVVKLLTENLRRHLMILQTNVQKWRTAHQRMLSRLKHDIGSVASVYGRLRIQVRWSTPRWNRRQDCSVASQIAKTFVSTSIRHQSDTFASDRCLIDVYPRGLLSGILNRKVARSNRAG